jgi:hypothetical protein
MGLWKISSKIEHGRPLDHPFVSALAGFPNVLPFGERKFTRYVEAVLTARLSI